MITDVELINAQIKANRPLSDLQFLEREIRDWLNSPERKMMIEGKEYYKYKQPINDKVRKAIGKDSTLVPLMNVVNHKWLDNQYAKLVDQKTNYLLALKPSMDGEDKKYIDHMQKIFNNKFLNKLRRVGTNTFQCGVGWLYVLPLNGELQFIRFEPEEVKPYWADSDHTILDALLRIYNAEEYQGAEKKIVQKVEFYDSEGITYYDLKDGILTLVGKVTHLRTSTGEFLNWEKLPVIPFRYNADEISLLTRVKSLQDGMNEILSKFGDDMSEDIRNTIIVLVNYDGEDLAEFRTNLMQYGAVKVRSEGQGSNGDVKTLQVEVNAENYKAILQVLKEKIIENGRGLDSKNDKMSGTPNQMNIKSMYSDLDLDANAMEAEFQSSLEELQWFIKKYLSWTGKGDFSNSSVEITFNRDILMSEAEAITMCRDSEGIISKETIITNHPWVNDVEKELIRVNKEREEQTNPYGSSFPTTGNKVMDDET